MLIRVDDTVEVIAGDDRGVRSRVLRVDRQAGKAGRRRASTACTSTSAAARRTRRVAGSPRRCRSSCPTCCWSATPCGQPTRLGARFLDDGSKERFCKKCGAERRTDRPGQGRAHSQDQ